MIEQDRIITADAAPQEQAFDRALRPVRLAEYVGQPAVKEQLEIFISAAKGRGEPLDHTLIFGPPGLGKTTLAHIIAQEMQVSLKSTSGPVLEKAGDLAALLTNLEPGDVLFVDEIHRLSPVVEEILYPAMEDYQLDIMIGEGPAARSIKLDLPQFTLVGATTRAGLLTSPLRDRFGIVQRLEFYSVEDLTQIVLRSGRKLSMTMDEEGAREVARRARGTPRIANRLLRRVRDFAEVRAEGKVDQAIADHALNLLKVDEHGFDVMDRRLLLMLMDKFDGGPVGVDSLAAAISEERDTIEDVIEPYLIQQGFLLRTPRGRVATRHAYLHFGLTPPERVAQQALSLMRGPSPRPRRAPMTESLSIWTLMSEATLLVQAVMLILVLASVVSWVMIVQRFQLITAARQELDAFEEDSGPAPIFGRFTVRWRSGRTVPLFPARSRFLWRGFASFPALGCLRGPGGCATGGSAGHARGPQPGGGTPRPEPALLCHRGLYQSLRRPVRNGVGHHEFLRQLATVNQASLATVAPGISEALIATAMGLFAAIPAVVAYNRFSTAVDGLMGRYDTFADEFASILYSPCSAGAAERGQLGATIGPGVAP